MQRGLALSERSESKGFTPILAVILITAALVGGYFVFKNSQTSNSPTPSPNQVACTQDAKLCPDGTYVSRVGPNCDFAACSEYTVSASKDGWKTYTNTKYGYSFDIPLSWSFSYGTVSSYDTTKVTGYGAMGSPSNEEVKFDVYQFPGVEKPTYSEEPPNDTLISESTITINGQQAWKQVLQTYAEGGGSVMTVSIPYKDRTVRFNIYPANTKHLDTIDQILSTFKFLP